MAIVGICVKHKFCPGKQGMRRCELGGTRVKKAGGDVRSSTQFGKDEKENGAEREKVRK